MARPWQGQCKLFHVILINVPAALATANWMDAFGPGDGTREFALSQQLGSILEPRTRTRE